MPTTVIFKAAFDRLYAHLGYDLKSILDPAAGLLIDTKIPKTTKKGIKIGHIWKELKYNKEILLEVSDQQLPLFKSTRAINRLYYTTNYKSSAHPTSHFFLSNQISNGSHLKNKMAMYDLFQDVAKIYGVGSFFTPAEEAELGITGSSRTRVTAPSSKDFEPGITLPPIWTTSAPEGLVIVDYTAPYTVYGWRGPIHLEIDLKKKKLTSAGWANGVFPLFPREEEDYLAFFSDPKNLNEFFDKSKAYDTHEDTRYDYLRWYDLRVQWNGRDKTIRVGYPDIPFKPPFWY